ncbi:MAG TPA: hypothetical protein VKX39_00625 [Bryobacteraceae bacterium]|jgi:hypothetical protein|nr:hypothetical protein [Bryobacteraceae bacterium]
MKSAFFFLGAIACAQSGLDQPRIGMMLDRGGVVRIVVGLPGSSSVGDPVLNGVVSFGCAAFCLEKTDSSLIAPGAVITAPAGGALFAFDSAGAFVYFSGAKQLARWQGGQLAPVDFEAPGEVISMRSVDGAAQFAVRIGGEVLIERQDGAVLGALPRATRLVTLLDNGVLFSTAKEIILRRADSSEMSFAVFGASAFFEMSPNYVEIRAAGGLFALRITPGKEQVFQLPEPAQ